VPENNRKPRKTVVGTVTSDKMQKTIVVRIEEKKPHPEYGKLVKQSLKYKVHDENNTAKIGDLVRIMQTRPLSKDKRWRLVEIVETKHKAESAETK
jgi:small subunit ribosomal protein S17